MLNNQTNKSPEVIFIKNSNAFDSDIVYFRILSVTEEKIIIKEEILMPEF